MVFPMSQVIDHSQEGRYELVEEGKLAFADYRLNGQVMIIPHVEADPALRGKGTAGRLMEGVLKSAREKGVKVTPLCGYAAAYIQRHPEYHDLLT